MAIGYNNAFGRGNLSSNFPNNQFGQMPFDSRDRGTDYFPGQSYASSTGGIPIPGPFGPAISQMLINPWLASKGIVLPPITGYSHGSYDYIQGQQRNAARSAGQGGIIAAMKGMGYPGVRETELGKSSIAVQMAEMFDMTYGGSQTKATDSLASRMSYMQRGTATGNYKDATETALAIRQGFTKNGGFDHKKSYGFDMSESVENLMSGLRYGNTGVNRDQFAELSTNAAGRAKIAGIAAAQNEKIRMGKQTFGSDMSADQINKLMDAAMGGMAGITPEKSTDFLAKIQTTARALSINAKGFAEYVAMQQNLYKQMGISGTAAATSIMTATVTGDAVSQMALTSGVGRRSMANVDTARSASARNTAKHQGSALLNNARAAAAIYDIMSPAQKAASQVGGQLTELETLISEGKSPEAQALINNISKKSGFSSLYTLGANMNEDIADRASRQIELQGRGDAETFRRSHIRKISGKLSNEQVAAVGGKAKLAAALSGVDFNDSEKVKEAIQAGTGASGDMASAIATSLVTRSTTLLARSKDRTGDMERLMVTTTKGRADLEAKKKEGELSDIKNKLANDRIGSLAKEFKIQEVGKFAADFIAAGGATGNKADMEAAIATMRKSGGMLAGNTAAANLNLEKYISEDAVKIQAAGRGLRGKDKTDAMDAERKRLNEERGNTPLTAAEEAAKKDAIAKHEKDAAEAKNNADKNIGTMADLLQKILDIIKQFAGPAAPPAPVN